LRPLEGCSGTLTEGKPRLTKVLPARAASPELLDQLRTISYPLWAFLRPAGLLLPALGRAKQKGKLAQCLSNLHQIGVGMHLYVDENHETFPPAESVQLDPNAFDYWHGNALGGVDGTGAGGPHIPPATNRLLAPFVSAPEAFHCPADCGDILDGVQFLHTFCLTRFELPLKLGIAG